MDPQQIKVEELPGVKAAVEQEQHQRQEAFVADAPEFICGVEVQQLTFRHVNLLRACKSPLLCHRDRMPTPSDLAQFLWACSPVYDTAKAIMDKIMPWSPKLAKWVFNRQRVKFARRLRNLSYAELIVGVDKYIQEAYADALGSSGTGLFISYYAGQCSAICMLSKEFGWAEKAIFDIPLKRLFQYLRWQIRHHNPSAPLANPSDQVRRKAVQNKIKEMTDAQAAEDLRRPAKKHLKKRKWKKK